MGKKLTVGTAHSGADIIVSSIHVDLVDWQVTVGLQRAIRYHRMICTLERAQEMGFINIQALEEYANAAFKGS